MSAPVPARDRRETLEKAKMFAKARLGVDRCSAPPEQGLADRYKPKLGRSVVRWHGEPEHGYLTYAEALQAAREYRDACRAMLNTPPAAPERDRREAIFIGTRIDEREPAKTP